MATRVSVVASGGAPFVRATVGAFIATPVEDGSGWPITLVASGAPPIVLVNDDLSQYAAPGVSDLLLENGGHLLQENGDAILLDTSYMLEETGGQLLQEDGFALLL